MTKEQVVAILKPFTVGPSYYDIPDDVVVLSDKPNTFQLTAGDIRAAQAFIRELRS